MYVFSFTSKYSKLKGDLNQNKFVKLYLHDPNLDTRERKMNNISLSISFMRLKWQVFGICEKQNENIFLEY